MNLPTNNDLEVWAITSVRGITKEERELAASNLFAAAKAYARALATAEQKAAARAMLMRDLGAQMNSFAERWEAFDKPALQAVTEKLEKAGVEIVQTPGQPATLVPCRLVKNAFDGAKGRGE